VCGLTGPTNIKADKGTIVHKVLEVMAKCSLALDNKENFIEDDVVGRFPSDGYDVDELTKRVYAYYSSQMNYHPWSKADEIDCMNWVNKALNYSGGKCDPRNLKIVQPEQRFNFEIKKKWAEYTQIINDVEVKGHLALKGTIDLITEVDENTLEVSDYKTGRRFNWATGKVKDMDSLRQDFQLRLYHYAASYLYPDKNIIISIYFVNDGGVFTLCFTREDLVETENIIRRKYEEILNTKIPKKSISWKCTKLCHLGKTTFEGTKNKPLMEYRDGKFAPIGSYMTMCDQLSLELQNKPMEQIIKEYTVDNFNVGFYSEPGNIKK
jgi:hypothetical protein